MSEEIHFLEDGYYVEKLEKENQQLKEVIVIKEKQLEEVRNNKTDYTKVNILEMQLDKYKEVIEEVRECINNHMKYNCGMNCADMKELLQILDKIKEMNKI